MKILQSTWKHPAVPYLVLLAVTFAVFGHMFTHEFLTNWDDDKYITANPDVIGFSIEHLRNVFTGFYVGNYAPLHILSYMLDVSIWGVNPAGFALTNIILHAGNGCLLYFILLRMNRSRLLAIVAALIFLVHPVQVESVAWFSQRKNLLAMSFFLLSFLSYQLFQERFKQKEYWFYSASLIFFSLSLLTKPVAIAFPLGLVLYDLCFGYRSGFRQKMAVILPFAVLAAAFALLAFVSQGSGGRTGYLGGEASIEFINMLPVLTKYLFLLLYPFNLNVIYNTPIKMAMDGEAILGATLLALFLVGWSILYFRRRELFFWLSLSVLMFLPVANIIPQITLMHDRYLYFPMLGIAALAGFAMQGTLERLESTRRIVAVTMMCAVIAVWGFAAQQRVLIWQDAVSLWTDAVAKSPTGSWFNFDSNFVTGNLAMALARKGNDLEKHGLKLEAISCYLRALTYDHLEHNALHSMASIAMAAGEINEAFRYAVALTENYSRDDRGFALLALIYGARGEVDKAREFAHKALEIAPHNPIARKVLDNIEEIREIR